MTKAPFALAFGALACGCATLVGADFDGLHAPADQAAGDGSGDVPGDAASDGPRPDGPAREGGGVDASADRPIEAAGPPHKTIFITSSAYSGNLGGLSGADATCQSHAASAGLGGTFRAWLSSDSFDVAARLTHATVPYNLVTGVTVARDWAQLTSGALSAPVDVTETGSLVAAGTLAWTGSASNGTKYAGNTCSTWTSTASGVYGIQGDAHVTSSYWTGAATGNCAVLSALYCIEQ